MNETEMTQETSKTEVNQQKKNKFPVPDITILRLNYWLEESYDQVVLQAFRSSRDGKFSSKNMLKYLAQRDFILYYNLYRWFNSIKDFQS